MKSSTEGLGVKKILGWTKSSNGILVLSARRMDWGPSPCHNLTRQSDCTPKLLHRNCQAVDQWDTLARNKENLPTAVQHATKSSV